MLYVLVVVQKANMRKRSLGAGIHLNLFILNDRSTPKATIFKNKEVQTVQSGYVAIPNDRCFRKILNFSSIEDIPPTLLLTETHAKQ